MLILFKHYDWHGCIITDIPIVADCLEFTVRLLSRSACLHAHVLSLLNYVLHEIYFAWLKYKLNSLHVLIFLYVVCFSFACYTSITVFTRNRVKFSRLARGFILSTFARSVYNPALVFHYTAVRVKCIIHIFPHTYQM